MDYEIQPGDTLSGIANKFGVPLGRLRQANPQIKNPNYIIAYDTITIPR